MKLFYKNLKIEKSSSFDHQRRLRLRRKISEILHPDRIIKNEIVSVSESLKSSEFFEKYFDEICCIKKLLKSLDNIFIMKNSKENLLFSNQRRHIICQIFTIFSTILIQISNNQSERDLLKLSEEISNFTSEIINILQLNYTSNCEEYSKADLDQETSIKLFLDLSYSIVPQLQLQL